LVILFINSKLKKWFARSGSASATGLDRIPMKASIDMEKKII